MKQNKDAARVERIKLEVMLMSVFLTSKGHFKRNYSMSFMEIVKKAIVAIIAAIHH